MNEKRILIFVSLLLTAIYSRAQQDNGAVYNNLYSIGKIPGYIGFETMTNQELRMDSLYFVTYLFEDSSFIEGLTNKMDENFEKRKFRSNRSRINLNSYTNEQPDKMDSSFISGFPTTCECFVSNDSLFVDMSAGFFGGFGLRIELTGTQFTSEFYEYTDDVKPYKAELTDTSFTSFVVAKSKFQYLVLNEKPEFKTGQQISGLLTLTSKDYYAQVAGERMDRHSVVGKAYFKCVAKEKVMQK